MTTREPIEGKVAQVLNTRELVINVGSDDGVKRGMIFEVLDDTGSEIRDPDTNELLGSVLRPKVRVKVTTVEPRLAVASTYRTRQKEYRRYWLRPLARVQRSAEVGRGS